MSRRVLVTGAGGFVGSHVVETLLRRTDWYVVALDSLRHNGMVSNFLDSINGRNEVNRVSWLTHDLTVPLSSRQRRHVGDVDFIVNVASQSHVDDSIAEPYAFIMNNIRLMMTMLELTRDLQPLRFIHMSTDEVFGSEDTPYGYSWPSTHHMPSSPYAASKAAQEDLLRSYARTYNVRSTVVNSANMFGERQSELAFIPRVIRALLRDDIVPIHFHDGKPGERSYTYVRNVADRIVDDMIFHDTDNSDFGAHSAPTLTRLALIGQRRIDNLTLAQMIAGVVGKPLSVHAIDASMVRPGYDPTYADLGDAWNPMTSFEDGIKFMVKWALEHYA